MPEFFNFNSRRKSTASAPDYSAKDAAKSVLKGDKKLKGDDDVNYRPGRNDAKICHNCRSYENPSNRESPCEKVIGMVESEATCDLWAVRRAEDRKYDDKPSVNISISTGPGPKGTDS